MKHDEDFDVNLTVRNRARIRQSRVGSSESKGILYINQGKRCPWKACRDQARIGKYTRTISELNEQICRPLNVTIITALAAREYFEILFDDKCL